MLFRSPDSKRPTKKIKQLLQVSHLPPWERENLPLIFVGKDLVYVPGLGIENRYQAQPLNMGLEVTWKR